jgi:N-acetylglutamate synthase-like GNAT family acetyltransferase
VQFKQYTRSNYKDCLALFELNCPAFFAVEERPDYQHYLKIKLDLYLLGYHGQSVVCCFGIENRIKDIAVLTWIMVHPDHHRRGYGQAMMSHFMASVATQATTKVLIATSQHAEAFFAKYGATRCGFQSDGWGKGMHRVDMEICL